MKSKNLAIVILGMLISFTLIYANSGSTSISEWKMLGRTLDNNRNYPDEINISRFGILWEYSTNGKVVSSPAIENRIVYFGSMDKNFYALNASTGKQIWNFTAPGFNTSSPALSDGLIYFTDGLNGLFFALNSTTGAQAWNFTFDAGSVGNLVDNHPSVSDGIVYVSSDEEGYAHVYAINSTNGTLIWNYSFQFGVMGIRTSNALSSNTLYFGTDWTSWEDTLFALNASTGIKLWSIRLNTSITSSHPVISDGVLFVGMVGNYTYAFNSTNGNQIWEYPTKARVYSSPVIGNNILYVTSYENKTYALNASTGKQIWNYTGENSVLNSSPVLANDILLTVTNSGKVIALNASTGVSILNYTLGTSMRSSPAIADGIIYVGNDNGKLYALSAGASPSVTLNSPKDNSNIYKSNVKFNFTAIDNMDAAVLCNLSINGSVNISNINAASNNTIENPVSFGAGDYVWQVMCWDSLNNTAISSSNKFNSVNTPPVLGTIPDIVVNESQLVYINATGNIIATDADGDIIVFNYSAPLNGSGYWQTTYNDARNYTVNITIFDGYGGTDSQLVKIVVQDVVNGKNDTVTGNISDIINNIPSLEVKINGSVFESGLVNPGLQKVTFTDGNATIIELDFEFTNTSKFSFTNIMINRTFNGREGIVIGGIDLTSQGKTKIVYLNQTNTSLNSVCVKDKDISSINELTSDCSGSNEVKLACDGITTNGYTCSIVGTYYKISGLSHTGIKQIPYNRPSGSPSSSSSSSSSSGGSSGGGGSSAPKAQEHKPDENKTIEQEKLITEKEENPKESQSDIPKENTDSENKREESKPWWQNLFGTGSITGKAIENLQKSGSIYAILTIVIVSAFGIGVYRKLKKQP